jgi:hypothetical protein
MFRTCANPEKQILILLWSPLQVAKITYKVTLQRNHRWLSINDRTKNVHQQISNLRTEFNRNRFPFCCAYRRLRPGCFPSWDEPKSKMSRFGHVTLRRSPSTLACIFLYFKLTIWSKACACRQVSSQASDYTSEVRCNYNSLAQLPDCCTYCHTQMLMCIDCYKSIVVSWSWSQGLALSSAATIQIWILIYVHKASSCMPHGTVQLYISTLPIVWKAGHSCSLTSLQLLLMVIGPRAPHFCICKQWI